jgi:hypothetical protein
VATEQLEHAADQQERQHEGQERELHDFERSSSIDEG